MKIIAFIMCFLMTIALCFLHSSRLQSSKYRRIALIANTKKQPEAILLAATKGIVANPFNVKLHGYFAHAYMIKKEYGKALVHLDIFTKYYPNDLNGLVNSAYANYYTGNMDDAFKITDRIKKIKPSYIKG